MWCPQRCIVWKAAYAVHKTDVRTAYAPEEKLTPMVSVSLLLLPYKGAAVQNGMALDLAEVTTGCLMVPWTTRYNESAFCDLCKIKGQAMLECAAPL